MQHACSTVSSERGKSTFLVGERGSPQHCTAGYRWMQAWWLTRPAFNQVRGLTWFAHAISPQKHSFNSCQFFVQFWMSTELHDVECQRAELWFELAFQVIVIVIVQVECERAELWFELGFQVISLWNCLALLEAQLWLILFQLVHWTMFSAIGILWAKLDSVNSINGNISFELSSLVSLLPLSLCSLFCLSHILGPGLSRAYYIQCQPCHF